MSNMMVDASYMASCVGKKYLNGATDVAKNMTVLGTVWLGDLETIGVLLQDTDGRFYFCNAFFMRELDLRDVARAINSDQVC